MKDGFRKLLHILDSAKVLLHLLHITCNLELLTLGVLLNLAGLDLLSISFHLLEAFRNGFKVGEGSAKPPMRDIRRANLFGQLLNGV